MESTSQYDAAGASERADAEKDAALTDSEIDRIWTMVTGTYTSDCPWDVHAFVHAAILAAKEKK
jgi:hypothetical protein